MHFEYLLPAAHVGEVYIYLPVEPAGTHQRGIEYVRTVCRRHYYYALVRLKAVHLDKYLVERLFALVVAAAKACTALPAHSIDLVHENYTGLVLLCHIEQVAHPRRAYADIHFNEVRTGYGEERYARLARNRLGKERFTCARRAYQKYTLGYAGAQVGEFFGLFKELYHLGKLKLLLFCAGHIGEAHLYICGYTCLAACKRHRAPATAGGRADDQPEYDAQQHEAAYRDYR